MRAKRCLHSFECATRYPTIFQSIVLNFRFSKDQVSFVGTHCSTLDLSSEGFSHIEPERRGMRRDCHLQVYPHPDSQQDCAHGSKENHYHQHNPCNMYAQLYKLPTKTYTIVVQTQKH